ncbi:MAG: asparagine synthase (glutamine-hydrolyzing) [Bdellovibrionales bacterium CG12_big_fil_rev_8_21_14_0_65_38_15]|nr:MAG: asparagine synthase (glutamine-hydrolyzing) [Bdellovibrionales bacterium CG22_combo_CG10-13_8_21_14_all_38_13]PIQ56531.1 MAG: asparagine synthase (glutamine-hydrolyzing) [Bdellovibrionales bacterium CG12_big_fil_rev_8_21_14_0_65_38_15]PIR31418.1 MAG: asparagine synthase (glutamine-hydrolyzing) [Bdellovibrionales bacterium CG11_big_fil_rev_8_21_14_0_20_38_13]
MCGVAGYLNLNGEPASEIIVKKMTDKISHRGPDGEGQYVDGSVGLGHRRLAIIDLSEAGKQPMLSRDSRFVISYNGEVYNYKEIRLQLEALGRKFRSNTDTEVILEAYAEWGEECVLKFNGMFAFAVWDKKEKKLFLARDRYGIKPLYYAFYKNTFLFSSENKVFNEYPGFERSIDKKGLLEYMTFQNFLGDKTLYSGISMFPAGHFAIISRENNKLEFKQYWDFHFTEPREVQLSENEYREELDFLVRQAVNRQLVSDVEIGSYLSGGMDSGSITALASHQLPYIKTFTVGFDLNSASGLELAYDERAKAEHMSYLFKTEHYEMVLKSGDMERCLTSLSYSLEEPRVGQSYPNYYAAKLASKFTKVVLSGAGGDEIFAGYPWRYYRSVGHKNFEAYIDEYYLYWQRLLPNAVLKELFAPIQQDTKDVWTRDIFRDVYKTHSNRLETAEDFINHSLYFEAKTFLHGLLVVEDKLSMAHSMETRVPFLDNDLVSFAMKLPIKYKLSNLNEVKRLNENVIGNKKNEYFKKTRDGKMLFRKAMEKYIPVTVTNREKQGFSAPDASWFRGESIDYVEKVLLDKNSKIYDYFDYKVVKKLLKEHSEGKVNRRLVIWSLINLHHTIKLL